MMGLYTKQYVQKFRKSTKWEFTTKEINNITNNRQVAEYKISNNTLLRKKSSVN